MCRWPGKARCLLASVEAQSESRFGTLTVTKRRRIGSRTREAIDCYIFMLPVILGLLLFYLGPMIASLYFSLTDYDMLTPAEWVGLQNYRDLADDDLFWKSLRVTAMYSAISVPLGLVLPWR